MTGKSNAFHIKQAGTGPRRRHIQGSKIAKGLQSFKVFSSTALNFFLKKVSQRRKKLKGGTLWSRPVLYVMREISWFCSLGQQVKFEIL